MTRHQEVAMWSTARHASLHTAELPADVVSAWCMYYSGCPCPVRPPSVCNQHSAGWKSHPVHSSQLSEMCAMIKSFCCFKGYYFFRVVCCIEIDNWSSKWINSFLNNMHCDRRDRATSLWDKEVTRFLYLLTVNKVGFERRKPIFRWKILSLKLVLWNNHTHTEPLWMPHPQMQTDDADVVFVTQISGFVIRNVMF